jgi:biotin carboxyl carrier protein
MKKYNITVNGVTYQVEVEEAGSAAPSPAAASVPASAPAPAPSNTPAAPSAGALKVECPMPGTILDVRVKDGQAVSEGDVLFILEAMKMENEIMAPQAGTVDAVQVIKGASVNAGDLLLTLK